jgi:L-aminopeptidase/D-esterase-like protein
MHPTRAPASGSGAITDVRGIRVGHHQRAGRGWRTGTTVVLAPDGTVGGVDVRGGGPGTRETDLLEPGNLVRRVDAICLTGGSAYGLDAAGGVMAWLEDRSIGFPVGVDGDHVVPIVPAAVVYDLGRGGVFTNRPDASFGRRAAGRARPGPVGEGAVGAGTGCLAGTLQGGVGTASERLADGTVVGALAVVNAAGHVIDPSTGLPWERSALPLRRPPGAQRAALRDQVTAGRPPLNTTIGVVATDARLDPADCHRLAVVAHDGMARAIRPVHTLFDGDTVFALATGSTPDEPDGAREPAARLARIQEAGARCFAVACTRAVVLASSHPGGPPSYRDLCPDAWT